MAGIGFELKKLFSRKGLLATIRAYGYAGIVCAGPMLLGIVLLLSVRIISELGGATNHQQDLLVAMITYTLLGSLLVTSLISMITTRFTADVMFNDKLEWVMPSFYGSTSILLIIGGIGYGVFLYFSGIPMLYQLLCFILFCELIVVWMQINYITAVKDYRNILILFFIGVAIAIFCAFACVKWLNFDIVSAMMSSVCIGYGIMLTGYFVILHKYFPRGSGSAFRFLEWIEKFPALNFIGFFLSIGLFAHLVITWFGPIGVHVQGLFYGAPKYDIPALVAFLSVLATTVNFVTSAEVNFYPKYRQYFSLFNDGGTMKDVEQAEKEMLTVLRQELNYLAQKQFVVAVLFIVVGAPLLMNTNLGFSEDMLGIFRTLCIGYGLYAIANSIMLMQLYLADNKGALIASFVFMVSSVLGTLALLNKGVNYYGFGFLVGAALMYIAAWFRIGVFTNKLQYHVICKQPLLVKAKRGIFTAISQKLVDRAEIKENKRARHSAQDQSATL